MISILMYVLAAGLGLLIAGLLSRAPELQPLRLSQLILVPLAMVAAIHFLPAPGGRYTMGDLGNFINYLGVAGFLALLLAPNIAHYCGVALTGFVDPHDWKPSEEGIELRPVQRLIDREAHAEALLFLDTLLKEHQPTYEALLLKTRLLYHFENTSEALDTLLRMLPLSQSTGQRLAIMDGLMVIEGPCRQALNPPGPGTRRAQIQHELLLVPVGATDTTVHAEIPPGVYEVESVLGEKQRWLRLVGQEWGNFEMCWEAVQQPARRPEIAPAPSHPFLNRIARLHQIIGHALTGRPDLEGQAEAKKLLREANDFIRQQQWSQALPLLQRASACDPHCYEIAYRLIEATRRCEDEETVTRTLRRVLGQSNWSENEEIMLQG